MDLQELKQQFLTHLKQEKGRSAKTIENYNRYLERFLDFAKLTKPQDIALEHIHQFRLHLNEQPGTKLGGATKPMKRKTQNYYLIALRSFLQYTNSCGIKTISPEQITLAKIPKRQVDLISSADVNRLRAMPNTQNLDGKRDKAILELLVSTGLRIAELCSLSVGDIDVSREEFIVQGKGSSKRVLYLSDHARHAIQNYTQARKDHHSAMFIRYGRKANDGGDLRIQPRAVQRLLKKYAALAGVTSRVTPHMIRHSFANNLWQSGADIRLVQSQLGHINTNTTLVYTKVLDQQTQEVDEKFHSR